MGAEMVDGTILTRSTGEVETPAEPVTVTQSGDNTSTDAVEFPAGPIVTGSHWADIVDRSETTDEGPEPEVTPVDPKGE